MNGIEVTFRDGQQCLKIPGLGFPVFTEEPKDWNGANAVIFESSSDMPQGHELQAFRRMELATVAERLSKYPVKHAVLWCDDSPLVGMMRVTMSIKVEFCSRRAKKRFKSQVIERQSTIINVASGAACDVASGAACNPLRN